MELDGACGKIRGQSMVKRVLEWCPIAERRRKGRQRKRWDVEVRQVWGERTCKKVSNDCLERKIMGRVYS